MRSDVGRLRIERRPCLRPQTAGRPREGPCPAIAALRRHARAPHERVPRHVADRNRSCRGRRDVAHVVERILRGIGDRRALGRLRDRARGLTDARMFTAPESQRIKIIER